VAYLAALGISIRDAELFYEVLCQASGCSQMPVDDFAEFCTRMKGDATAIDVACLQYELRGLRRDFRQMLLELDSDAGGAAAAHHFNRSAALTMGLSVSSSEKLA